MNTTYWKSKDYLAFVLLYMATADADLSMSELYHMASRLGADRVIGMRSYLESLTEPEQLKLIKKQRDRFYPGEFGKSSLLSEIKELCMIDGDFSIIEKELMKTFQKTL